MAHFSRKRPRCEDDCCELMPISKRINDLHIRSNLADPNTSVNNNTIPEMHSRIKTNRDICNGIYFPEAQRDLIAMRDGNNAVCNYRPELSASQNPYYYHVNGVLYEAHAMRMQRLTK